MYIKLLFILSLFSTSLSAATFLKAAPPIYFFDMPDETFICNASSVPLTCIGYHKETDVKIKYYCIATTPELGYLKECAVVNGVLI